MVGTKTLGSSYGLTSSKETNRIMDGNHISTSSTLENNRRSERSQENSRSFQLDDQYAVSTPTIDHPHYRKEREEVFPVKKW